MEIKGEDSRRDILDTLENKGRKSREEIIKRIEDTIWIADKFYINGLLWCLGRKDLGISHDKNYTGKIKNIKNKILEEIKK
jgi:hypothetical protein